MKTFILIYSIVTSVFFIPNFITYCYYKYRTSSYGNIRYYASNTALSWFWPIIVIKFIYEFCQDAF